MCLSIHFVALLGTQEQRYDKIAAYVCIFLFFIILTVFAAVETLVSLCMDMYKYACSRTESKVLTFKLFNKIHRRFEALVLGIYDNLSQHETITNTAYFDTIATKLPGNNRLL